MKARIFTASITTIRGGQQLANKAGFFRFDRHFCSYTAICTCRSGSVMAPESRLERVVIDSGKGKSLFCLLENVNHNHVPRNSYTSRAKAGTNPPGTSASQPRRSKAVFFAAQPPLIC